MGESFFEIVDGSTYRATGHTVGPWSPDAQHGGPPSALLGREMEGCEFRPGWLLARVTVEILGPVPVDVLRVSARVARPGRSVELMEATLHHGERAVMRASGWRIRQNQGTVPATDAEPLPSRPDDVAPAAIDWPGGYLTALEWRFTSGKFAEPGPATAWTRARYPLVPDEPISPVQRVLLAADSGSGISSELHPSNWLFINPELTVHLHRPPAGEWVCLDSRTTMDADGVGLAETRLFDARGAIGRAAQSLLLARRT